MATVTLTNPLFYAAGKGGVTSIVGIEAHRTRNVRYTMIAPASGATAISITFTKCKLVDGSTPPLKVYIGTDPNSHADAQKGFAYSFDLTLSGTETYTGAGNVILLPNQTYYVWVFTNWDPATTYGYIDWPNGTSGITATTSGGTRSEISGSNGILSSQHTVTLKRYSDELTHNITAACGDETATIATGTKADSVKWTPPIAWAAQNTSGTSVTVTITCTTYSGSTAVGSHSITLTFQIPASVVPSMTVSVSDKQGHLTTYGSYIQGKSKAAVAVSASGAYGSTIKSCAVTCGTLSGTGTSLAFDLPASGDIEITVTVTDSRGRTATYTTTISVAAYSPPGVLITSAYRCDADGNEVDDGTYGMVTFNAAVSALYDKNTASYILKYRVAGTSVWYSIPISDLENNFTPEGASQIISGLSDAAYEVTVQVTDNFAPVMSAYRNIRAVFVLMDWDRASKALGFGQKANVPGTAAFALPALIPSVNDVYIRKKSLSASSSLAIQTKHSSFEGTGNGRQAIFLFGYDNGTLIYGVIGVRDNGECSWSGTEGVSVSVGDSGKITVAMPAPAYDSFTLISPAYFSV